MIKFGFSVVQNLSDSTCRILGDAVFSFWKCEQIICEERVRHFLFLLLASCLLGKKKTGNRIRDALPFKQHDNEWRYVLGMGIQRTTRRRSLLCCCIRHQFDVQYSPYQDGSCCNGNSERHNSWFSGNTPLGAWQRKIQPPYRFIHSQVQQGFHKSWQRPAVWGSSEGMSWLWAFSMPQSQDKNLSRTRRICRKRENQSRSSIPEKENDDYEKEGPVERTAPRYSLLRETSTSCWQTSSMPVTNSFHNCSHYQARGKRYFGRPLLGRRYG